MATFKPWSKRFAKAKSDELKKLLKRAFEHEYAAGMLEPDEDDDTHDAIVVADSLDSYEYKCSDWAYLHERSTGGYPVCGAIFVTYMGVLRWMMVYSGQVLNRTNLGDITSALDEALDHIDSTQPIRGPERFSAKNGLTYRNNFRGDIAQFEGDEFITRDDATIYKLHYGGGFIGLK